MTGSHTVLDSGTVRLEFTTTTPELHEMRATYAPWSPLPPAHLHPAQTERFAVHEGELLFLVDGVESTVGAGEVIEVPPGAVHQVCNPGDVPAVATWQTRPALRSAEFHCAIAAARESGDLAQLLGVVEEYSDVFVLAPQPVDP
ncbi:MAG: cupin domain-containing protein [Frankiales bacterium]|nr:MAG: cupin domain-containing protein [Frankiales bacterium]